MRTIVLIWALCCTLGSVARAQGDCTPVVVELAWQGMSTQPALLTFLVVSPEGVVVPGITLPFVSGPQQLNQTICLAPGCYTVMVGSNVPLNGELLDVGFEGQGLEVSQTADGVWEWVWSLCVEGADCPEAIDYAQGEGCAWAFEIGSFVAGESVIWNFGDGTEQVGGHFVTHAFPGNGMYVVTAAYTSSLCPEPVLLATEVGVEGCGGNCDFPIFVGDAGCNAWEIGVQGLPQGSQVIWTWQNDVIGDGVGVFFAPDWSEIEADCTPVVAQVNAAGCPPQALTALVCEESCGGDCPLELSWTSPDGVMHIFTATGAPEGAIYTWWVDGVMLEEGPTGVVELGFDFNPFWTVCVAYETPECSAETCAQNPPVSCGFEVSAEEVAPGVWVLTALGPNGGVWDGPVEWSLGNGEQTSGNPVAWTWETPGAYPVCAQAPATPACPDGPFACTEVETAGTGCEEVQVVLTPTGAVVTGFGLTLALEPDWLGLPVGGWDWSQNWECPAGWLGDTITICLPAVCFGVELDVPGWVWESVGGMTAQLGDAGPLVWDAMEWAGQTYSQNPSCAVSSPAVSAPRPGLHAAPIPASDAVAVAFDFAGVADWQVRTTTGALQASGRSASPFSLDVRSWSPGWYLLQLQTPQGISTKKLVVLRD